MVTFETSEFVTRVTIQRSDLPEVNTAMVLAIIGSLTAANNPVVNTDEFVVFNFSNEIPYDILHSFLHRWGVSMIGFKFIET